MKQLIEFIPIALFGGVYFWTRDIFIATMVLMGGIVLQLAVEYWTTKTVSRQTQIIFWSAILLGGATLLFRNEEFLFWKPTICLLYTSPSPRDRTRSRMPSSA